MAVSKVTRSFPCTVEQLWQIVTDLTHTDWRSDLVRVEVLDETRFVEHTKSGYATHFAVTTCRPKKFWAFTMENGNMSGSWEGQFEAMEGGSQLACVETVNGKRWWMRPFVPGYLKRQQKLYMDDLLREVNRITDGNATR